MNYEKKGRSYNLKALCNQQGNVQFLICSLASSKPASESPPNLYHRGIMALQNSQDPSGAHPSGLPVVEGQI